MVSRVVWGIISKALKESSTLSVTIKMVHSIGVGGFNCSWHITVGLLMDHNVIKCNWPPITTTQFIYLLVKLVWFETTKDHLALWPPSPAIQFAWFETTMDHLTEWPPSTMTHFVWFNDTNEYLPCLEIFVYVELKILEYMPFVVTNRCFSGSEAVKSGLLLQRYWNF